MDLAMQEKERKIYTLTDALAKEHKKNLENLTSKSMSFGNKSENISPEKSSRRHSVDEVKSDSFQNKNLQKTYEKLQNDLRYKTTKNVELYQRVFWLESELRKLGITGIPTREKLSKETASSYENEILNDVANSNNTESTKVKSNPHPEGSALHKLIETSTKNKPLESTNFEDPLWGPADLGFKPKTDAMAKAMEHVKPQEHDASTAKFVHDHLENFSKSNDVLQITGKNSPATNAAQQSPLLNYLKENNYSGRMVPENANNENRSLLRNQRYNEDMVNSNNNNDAHLNFSNKKVDPQITSPSLDNIANQTMEILNQSSNLPITSAFTSPNKASMQILSNANPGLFSFEHPDVMAAKQMGGNKFVDFTPNLFGNNNISQELTTNANEHFKNFQLNRKEATGRLNVTPAFTGNTDPLVFKPVNLGERIFTQPTVGVMGSSSARTNMHQAHYSNRAVQEGKGNVIQAHQEVNDFSVNESALEANHHHHYTIQNVDELRFKTQPPAVPLIEKMASEYSDAERKRGMFPISRYDGGTHDDPNSQKKKLIIHKVLSDGGDLTDAAHALNDKSMYLRNNYMSTPNTGRATDLNNSTRNMDASGSIHVPGSIASNINSRNSTADKRNNATRFEDLVAPSNNYATNSLEPSTEKKYRSSETSGDDDGLDNI